MADLTGILTYPSIVGFYRRKDGEEYVIWAEAGNRWHVTNGITDTDEPKAVRDWCKMLKRDRIDERKMLGLLRRYQPGSPLIGLMEKNDRGLRRRPGLKPAGARRPQA